MAELDNVRQHEPFGISTRKVVLATAAFLSLVGIALVMVAVMFGAMGVSRGPSAIDLPLVKDQPRLQVRPADDLFDLRRIHEAQLEEGPVAIEEAMQIVARRRDPAAPLTEAERREAAR